MTYPPHHSGGYPPAGYPAYPPTPPPRSPWSSPLVLVAIAIGVVLVIGAGALTWWLTSSNDSGADAGPSTSTFTNTVTVGAGTAPGGTTSVQSRPTVSGTDSQGFLSSSARCDSPDTAVAVGRTNRSQVVICRSGVGSLYYMGAADGNSLRVTTVQDNGSSYTAINGNYTYTVSPGSLVITQSGSVIGNETMQDYWAS
ncbi:MAG: hypothetical protein QM662_14875 [Gordonia sp. (in: high G+C Gram-positive bacteria)]